MKKVLLLLAVLMTAALGRAQIIVQGEITTNTTWSNNNIYILDGWVFVRAGATLTIEPGTIIKGDQVSKGALIIERDAKIIADGTPTQPIVFTSQKPAGQRGYGDWGGVIICGRASVNAPANAGNGTAAGEAIIEGGVGSIYGGGANPNDADNSGILRYVRIEFGGIPFQPNNEINGLTLGGVGSGTIIENVMVSYNGDDAFEWFGGTVNAKYLISYKTWDDDFDTDFGYKGKVQFGLAVRDPDIADQSGSNGFESDNDATGTTNTPITQPIFSNMTVIGPYAFSGTINSLYRRALHLRRNTRTNTFNSIFAGWPTGLLIDGSSTHTNAMNGELKFRNSVLAVFNDTLATTANPDPNNVTGSFNITNWFNTSEWNNSTFNAISDLQFRNVSLADPDFSLQLNSPLNTGAIFSDPALAGSFFTNVNYRGAFGTEDWTACWAEWDPQNADYNNPPINNAFNVTVTPNGPTQFCQGQSVVLSANAGTGTYTYTWSNGGSAASITAGSSGNYSVVATNSDRCSATSNIVAVTVNPLPTVSISADGNTSFCTGGSVVLTSSQPNGNVWSTGATTQSITVDTDGNYSVTHTDGNGCSATSNTISVSVSDSPVPTINTSGNTTICSGNSVTLTASASDSYQWYLNGNMINGATAQQYTATQQGLYTVAVSNDNPCDGVGTSAPVGVFVNPSPVAAGAISSYNTLTVSFINNSTNATSYLWNFGDGNTSADINPVHTYATSYQGQALTVTLTAYNGECSNVTTIQTLPLSLEEITVMGSLTISPNPANEQVWIRLEGVDAGMTVVNLIDITGKVVAAEQMNYAGGVLQTTFDLGHLANGLYFIQVQGENFSSSPAKLMVRH